jgi:rhodanese-related sulfurtransferase
MTTPKRPGSFLLLPACSVLAVTLWCASLPACAEKKVSDRDVSFVDPADAYELSQGSSGVLGIGRSTAAWVDPRPASKYEAGRIPGAISVPIDTVIENDSRLNDVGTIIVYGDDYGDPVAVAMAKKLLALGYSDVRTLRGGLRAWKQEGNEVEGE